MSPGAFGQFKNIRAERIAEQKRPSRTRKFLPSFFQKAAKSGKKRQKAAKSGKKLVDEIP